MDFNKFKDQFHESWRGKIKKFIESKECDELYTFLKKESQRGKDIAPLSSLTFRIFKDIPLNEIKVVLLGYCPYHTFVKGSPVADGYGFSCGVTGKLQPSLEKFYEGLEIELYNGLNLEYIKNPDLEYLVKQGVFLWNSSLTVEKNKPGSHQDKWLPFTKFVLEECLAYTGIPIIFIGKDAAAYKKLVTPLTHGHIFEVEHPAYAARINADWDTQGVFTKVNRIIKENNNYSIKWLCSKEEMENIVEEIPF